MTRVRAVLIDAMGTLLDLEAPVGRLRAALRDRTGIEFDGPAAAAALRAEIAYYKAHHLEGRDAATLDDLRDRCAAVLAAELGGVEPAAARAALLDALRFRAHDDAEPALRALRERDLRLVAVSNWDVSLHDALAGAGLAPLLDGVVSSAEVGAAKPDPRPFRRALGLAGARPDEAVHVGDSRREDVEGARAAGIEPVLVVRAAGPAGPPAPPPTALPPAPAGVVRSLLELPGLLDRAP